MKPRMITDFKGYRLISPDKRTVRVAFSNKTKTWVLKGRKPHKKIISIQFSHEAMMNILKLINAMRCTPEVKETEKNMPVFLWKQFPLKKGKKPITV